MTELRFDRTSASAGSRFVAGFFGNNLDSQTFFDVRFRAPGSNLDQEVENWQRDKYQPRGSAWHNAWNLDHHWREASPN